MAGILNIPKFVDFRNKVKRHSTKKFPVLSLKGKTTIAIHHSLTKQGLGGSNAESYARYHVDSLGWPSIGYSYVIEPDGTIKFCNPIEWRTYHVGNHNNYAVGICLTGDFRSEKPTKAQEESLRNLVAALQKAYPQLKNVKGHNEFSGYEWKACPVFNYKAVLAGKGTVTTPVNVPDKYIIQEGDTFWGIAHNNDGITVEDLIAANPGVEPTKLKIGQTINLGKAKNAYTPKPETPKKPQSTYKYPLPAGVLRNGSRGNNVKQLQEALNAVYFKVGKADGILGPKTVDAIRRFQMVYLPYQVDGVYGPNTQKKLQAVLKSKGH